jgi:AI-2 transport protein TqsA
MNEPPLLNPPTSSFRHQLMVATFGLLFVVLVIHLLERFALIIQQFLVAVLIAYVLFPVHSWLVRRGVRSWLAFALILALLLGVFVGVGLAFYSSASTITSERVAEYREKLEQLAVWGGGFLVKFGTPPVHDQIRQLIAQLNTQDVLQVAGSVQRNVTFALIVFVYLVFLVAEKITFPRRLGLAFGEQKATHLLSVVGSINEAIAHYIAIKTWISFVTGLLSFVVLAVFGVEFAVVWAVLIFLLNFIPYIGSLVAVTPPILLAFLQFDEVWHGIVVTALLVGVQLFTGQFMEPKLAGRRLNLSPLLILLSLAFWGYMWGVVGMILAVPLTVVCKIILDNIPATKPLGSLMSNV